LLTTRRVERWQTTDYRIRQMFEAADVMSEGASRQEHSGHVYYGTTSIVLPTVSKGGYIPDAELSRMAFVLDRSPHARVRAIRIACREALVRSNRPLGPLRAELVFSCASSGVKIDVDVEAPELAQYKPAKQAP
jgi:hypothetical protein